MSYKLYALVNVVLSSWGHGMSEHVLVPVIRISLDAMSTMTSDSMNTRYFNVNAASGPFFSCGF